MKSVRVCVCVYLTMLNVLDWTWVACVIGRASNVIWRTKLIYIGFYMQLQLRNEVRSLTRNVHIHTQHARFGDVVVVDR